MLYDNQKDMAQGPGMFSDICVQNGTVLYIYGYFMPMKHFNTNKLFVLKSRQKDVIEVRIELSPRNTYFHNYHDY